MPIGQMDIGAWDALPMDSPVPVFSSTSDNLAVLAVDRDDGSSGNPSSFLVPTDNLKVGEPFMILGNHNAYSASGIWDGMKF